MEDDVIAIIRRREIEEQRQREKKALAEKAEEDRQKAELIRQIKSEVPLALNRLARENYPGARIVTVRAADGSSSEVAQWEVCQLGTEYMGTSRNEEICTYKLFVRSNSSFVYRLVGYSIDDRIKGPSEDLDFDFDLAQLTTVFGSLRQFGITKHRRET